MSTRHGSLSLQAIRRLQGGELLENGYGLDEVVEITGASLSAVKRWKKKIDEGGIPALARKPNSGRKPSLTPEQFDELRQIVKAGAVVSGFSNDRWTSRIVADLIRKKRGVDYAPSHVRHILRSLHLSYQKPDLKSTKHSQAAVDRWRRYVWTRIKKKPTTTVTS